jgi:hypothetical protein
MILADFSIRMLLFTFSWWYPFFFIVYSTPRKKGSFSRRKPARSRCRMVTLAG